MKKRKKKFFDTTFGSILKGAVGVVAPNVADLLGSGVDLHEGIQSIVKSNQLTPEQKEHFKNLAHELEIKQFEAEVADRQSARTREIEILNAGGDNYLMNIIGYGITIAFLLIVLSGIGVIRMPENIDMNYLMFASGAVSSAFMTVVAYFFGSSMGSKQKTTLMKN